MADLIVAAKIRLGVAGFATKIVGGCNFRCVNREKEQKKIRAKEQKIF